MLKNNHKGRYNNDYSPKYSDPYDIYEKAKTHMVNLKKSEKASENSSDSENTKSPKSNT